MPNAYIYKTRAYQLLRGYAGVFWFVLWSLSSYKLFSLCLDKYTQSAWQVILIGTMASLACLFLVEHLIKLGSGLLPLGKSSTKVDNSVVRIPPAAHASTDATPMEVPVSSSEEEGTEIDE